MTLADHYAQVLGRLTRLLVLQRAHLLSCPEAYNSGIGADLFRQIVEDSAWLLVTPPPEVTAPAGPRS